MTAASFLITYAITIISLFVFPSFFFFFSIYGSQWTKVLMIRLGTQPTSNIYKISNTHYSTTNGPKYPP
jgi:hypothetical protein